MVKPIILDRNHWEIDAKRNKVWLTCPKCGYRGQLLCLVNEEGLVGAPLTCFACAFHGEQVQLEGWGRWGPPEPVD